MKGKSSTSCLRVVTAVASAAAAMAVDHAVAQDQDGDALEEIVVRASRLPSNTESFPGSFTIVDAEDIERQRAFNKDMISLLSQEVPGLATSAGSISNFDVPLRGRSAVVLIDGVPITPTLRPAGRDLVSVDASVISSIEVIRGASAIYGNGGAGGVINYQTRQPVGEDLQFTSEVGVGGSVTHPGDSWNPSLLQIVEGSSGAFDFIVSGSYEKVNSLFDADGDRIAPSQTGNGGLPDSDIVNLFGKAGYDWDDRRVEASVLYFDFGQDTDYFAVPGDIATREKAIAERGTLDPRAQDEGNTNSVVNVVFTDRDIAGSSLRLQAYRQDVEQTFDFRADRFGGSQTLIDSEKTGARLDINTPFSIGAAEGSLLWGLDFTNDKTAQLLTDGRIFVPYLDQDAFAQFLQLDLAVSKWLDVQAGLRNEDFDVSVEPFTSLTSGAAIDGGKLDYGETVYNVGAVFHPIADIDLFATFSQGYSLSDIGREIRDTAVPGFVETLRPEPVVLDNYEVGMRVRGDSYAGGLAAFRSESDLGARFVEDPDNPGVLIQRRDPEKVHGAEAWIDADLNPEWRTGGSITWIEGKVDTDDDGSFDTWLDSRRTPPVKITAYLEYERPDLRLRLQALYSGSRDRFGGSLQRSLGAVDSFLTVDAMAALPLGPGEFSLGIQNLLNEDYFPVSAQTQNVADRLVKAPGASIMARYRLSY